MLKNLTFHIIESHSNLQKIQKLKFSRSFGDKIKIIHYENLKNCSFENAFFISNELLDTFACEVLKDGKMLYIQNNKPVFKKNG